MVCVIDSALYLKLFEPAIFLFNVQYFNIFVLNITLISILKKFALHGFYSFHLTMNVYARAKDERLADLIEKVGNTVRSD